MYSFRQRPLTWLFWIATICLTAVGALKSNEATWFGLLLTGQLYVLSGWMGISQAHRLARGAVLVIAPLWLTAMVLRSQRTPNGEEAKTVLGVAMALGGIVFLATAIIAAILRLGPAQRTTNRSRWQISVAEILGWTIVVAIASWSVSHAMLPSWATIHGPLSMTLSAILAGTLISLFLAPQPPHDRVSTAMATILVATYFAVMRWEGVLSSELGAMAALLAFVGLWVLVVRLDEQAAGLQATGKSSGVED